MEFLWFGIAVSWSCCSARPRLDRPEGPAGRAARPRRRTQRASREAGRAAQTDVQPAHPPARTRAAPDLLEQPRVEVAERPVDRAQPVRQRSRAGPVAGVEPVGQLVHPAGVRRRPVPGVPGRVSWLTMNAQSLDSASSASRASWSSTGSRTGPRCASTVDSSRSCTPLAASTRSCTAGPSQTRQSLPEPQDDRPSVDRRPDVAGRGRAAQRGHPHAGGRQLPQHGRQPGRPLVPPVPEQLGVERGDDQARPPVPVGAAAAAGPARRRRSPPRPGVPPPRPGPAPTASSVSGGTCRPVTRAGRKPEAWSKVWKSR